MAISLVWFRNDLRLHDNSAWQAALQAGDAILPVYIYESTEQESLALGGASQWWLHHALADLNESLEAIGGRLIIHKGDPRQVVRKLVDGHSVARVFWNRRYEPEKTRIDSEIKENLRNEDLIVSSFNTSLLFEPWEVATQQGNPYKVYTPFRKSTEKKQAPVAIECDNSHFNMAVGIDSGLKLEELSLLPDRDWADHFSEMWTPTRAGGLARLNQFLDGPVLSYNEKRNFPAEDGTSRLSPYLYWGQVGVREVADKVRPKLKSENAATFYHELVWREFAYHVLYHFPKTPSEPLQDKYRDFPWQSDAKLLQAWQKGKTGYPLVDAGMRQLWKHGWMHNRVRMVVASLLVKHLLQPWQDGADWFLDCLVDADLASNTLGWQWAGGCGADAAPYFRIFNPIIQSEKFDREGVYIRTYVPELKNLPDKHIHQPWNAPESVLQDAGVELGKSYPYPIIGHSEGRERALAALEKIK